MEETGEHRPKAEGGQFRSDETKNARQPGKGLGTKGFTKTGRKTENPSASFAGT